MKFVSYSQLIVTFLVDYVETERCTVGIEVISILRKCFLRDLGNDLARLSKLPQI